MALQKGRIFFVHLVTFLFASNARTFTRRTNFESHQSLKYGNQSIEMVAIESKIELYQDSDPSSPNLQEWDTIDSSKDELNSNFLVNVSVWDCGSPEVKSLSYTLDPCQSQEPCTVKKGSSITLNVKFTANSPATYLSCDIMIHKGIITRHFDCGQSNMCNTPGIKCPLNVGQQYWFSVTKGISPQVPAWVWYMEGNLYDENRNKFLCVGAHLNVVS